MKHISIWKLHETLIYNNIVYLNLSFDQQNITTNHYFHIYKKGVSILLVHKKDYQPI